MLAFVAKLVASYLRYITLVVGYEGKNRAGDATRYHETGHELALWWLNKGPDPNLPNYRRTNFVYWFDGVVQTIVGNDFLAGFFVFGLLAVAGSYMWYRAAADVVPILDKRLYFLFIMFAPSIIFWPSSVGKEALMQLGIGALSLGLARLVQRRIFAGLLICAPAGWLVWVVRPHLLAIVAVAGGFAYLVGRVKSSRGGILLSRPLGIIVIAILVGFTVSQGAEYLGLEDFSLNSIEQTLDEQTERTSQGGSKFDPGDNSLNPIDLPASPHDGARASVPVGSRELVPAARVTRVDVVGGLDRRAVQFGARHRSETRRRMPFLLYGWLLVLLYCAAYAAFANFGLLVRQRSLVFPALLLLLAVDPVLAARAERRAMEEAEAAAAGWRCRRTRWCSRVRLRCSRRSRRRPRRSTRCAARRPAWSSSSITGSAPVRGSRSTCRSSVFDAQMAWLAATGRVVTLDAALDLLAAPPPPTDGPTDGDETRIVVTFDDGTADFADHAVPVLARHGIPATLYAATAFIDEGVAFPDDGGPVSWAALRDAQSTGLVDIGSHTHSHRLLDRLPPDEVDDELDRSIDLIAEHVGRAPRDFAYPKALLGSPAAERAVRVRFRSAAIAGTRANPYAASDPYRLCAVARAGERRRSAGSSTRRAAAWRSRTMLRRLAEPPAVLGGRHVTRPRSGPRRRGARPVVAHVTTTDMSLELLLGPQLEALAASRVRDRRCCRRRDRTSTRSRRAACGTSRSSTRRGAWRPSRTHARCSSSSLGSVRCGLRSCTRTTRSPACTAGSPLAWRGYPSS